MITTARLVLRHFTLADVPALYAMSREPLLGRWIPDQVYRDEAHAEEVARLLMSLATHRDPRTKPYVLGIEHGGALIGHVGLSAARGSVEIGYAIAQAQHGKGFATEAVAAMSSWALAELGLPEVLGIVEAENVPSCRVLEKAGFVRGADDERGRRVYRRIAA